MSDKQAVLKLVNRLPDTASLHDVLDAIKFMAEVQEGLAEIDQDKGVPIEAVEQRFETMLHDGDSATTIIRTERGLTISGTRITLYDIMDYARSLSDFRNSQHNHDASLFAKLPCPT